MSKKIWFWIIVVSSSIYLGWRFFFTLPLEFGIISLIAGIALFISEFFSALEAIINNVLLAHYTHPEKPIIYPEDYPHVDVFIATHSEAPDLLFKTINGCKHMEYPDKSKVHIYLCDDKNRPEMAKLAQDMEIGYIPLAENKFAKAGNLNNAMSKTDSPLVVTFDANMIPRSSFLMETIPFFFLPKMIKDNGVWRKRTKKEIDPNYKIGFLQTPQTFYNPDLFQFNFFAENNIPNDQSYFFDEINIARNVTNSVIYAGSNTVLSRQALNDVGGFRTHTITEDMATGMDIQEKGYTSLSIKKPLASGLTPEDFPSFVKQRQRWGRGNVQILFRLKFWLSKLPISTKFSYFNSLIYWWTSIRRIIYIISPILYSVFGVIVVKISETSFLLFGLPFYLVYNHAIKKLSEKVRDHKWSNIVDTIMAPYMALPILLETFGLKMNSFIVTSKERIENKSANLLYATPHIILLVATIVGIYLEITKMVLYQNYFGIVILFWLFYNGYFLVMAILFMTGRSNYRQFARYYCSVPVSIQLEQRQIECFTYDISELGFSFLLDFPECLNGILNFTLTNQQWKASVKGQIVHVSQFGQKWKYGVELEPLSFLEKQDYFQIVYDRTHTLATVIKTTAIEDLENFFYHKIKKIESSNRKLPRIQLNQQVKTDIGQTLTILDYNYQYVTIKENVLKNQFSIYLGDAQLSLQKVENKSRKNNLFMVENWQKIATSTEVRTFLQNSIPSTKSA